MSFISQASNALGGALNKIGINYPNQASTTGDPLMNAINDFTGMHFDNIADFLSYYRSNYFKTAYHQLGLNPTACFQLGMSNPWVGGAVNAISKPIGSANIVANPSEVGAKPNTVIKEYLENLFKYPNPTPSAPFFLEQIKSDQKYCGAAYIEVNYNEAGFPARFDRINPTQIKTKKQGGQGVYVKDNGYIFPDESLIVIMEPNPLDNYIGLSPQVRIFNHLMLDEALTEHNLRAFTKDMLKGLISLDSKNMDHDTASAEVARLQESIKEMQATGESGHLLVYGATFHAMNNTNKDMLTGEISENIIQAVKTVYRVPPLKMMQYVPGHLGGQDKSQEDTMNETLIDEMDSMLRFFNYFFTRYVGISDTVLSYSNLTSSDLNQQAELDRVYISEQHSKSIDEVRTGRGEEPYNKPWSQVPLVDNRLMPASLLENYEQPGQVQASVVGGETAVDQNEILETQIRERVRNMLTTQ